FFAERPARGRATTHQANDLELGHRVVRAGVAGAHVAAAGHEDSKGIGHCDPCGSTTRPGHVRRSSSMAERGTPVISASFPWLVSTVRMTFEMANQCPPDSTLARNRPSFLSVTMSLFERA